eukprot:364371-Chlamydomonas_euryale.AAC.1
MPVPRRPLRRRGRRTMHCTLTHTPARAHAAARPRRRCRCCRRQHAARLAEQKAPSCMQWGEDGFRGEQKKEQGRLQRRSASCRAESAFL